MPRLMKSKTIPVVAALAALLTAAACGGGSDDSNSEAAKPLTVEGVEFPAVEKTSITLGVSALSVGDLPAYIIDYSKLGEKFGINVKLRLFQGDAPTSQALAAGQIDVADMSAGIAVSSQKTASPNIITFVSNDKMADLFMGGKKIKTPNDLKGKAIAVSSFGSQSYAGALLSLKALGLAKDDVTITPVGNDSARLAALQAGSVGASIQDVDKGPILTKEGFNILVELAKLDVAGYVTASLTVPEKFAKENPNTTLALTAMYQMGRQMATADLDTATKAWAKTAEITEEQAKTEVQARNNVQRPFDGVCRPEVMDFVKEVLSSNDPEIAKVDATKACSNEFTDKLKSMGFQKAIGVEGY